jgi:nucleoside-triphosphatase THEP1
LPGSFPERGRAPDAIQKRFVICGIAGSGKTQFCCKFAEDNRDQ